MRAGIHQQTTISAVRCLVASVPLAMCASQVNAELYKYVNENVIRARDTKIASVERFIKTSGTNLS
ncbi:MAG: hypothetical protein CMQ21_10380 [Gammaproteobacteria bacterium]|jgi:hypothetical protein|nr:hypothetical protein [Gammaproteobacteria bacterium]